MKQSLAKKVLPKSFMDKLGRILIAHNGFNNEEAGNRRGAGTGKKKQSSAATQSYRHDCLHLAFAQLWEIGYKLREPENLSERHVDLIVRHWGESKLAASTLQTRIAVLNVFSRWIGKPGIVKNHREYFPEGDSRRTSIAQKDLSWDAHNINAKKVIAVASRMDERFGVMLELQLRFGLRMKESCELRPNRSLVDSGQAIEIYEGTKGGRLRRIEILTKEQRDAFDRARYLAADGKTGRLRWPGQTWSQARNRFYWYMRKMGLTRAELGVTAHGLRHEFAQREYMAETGLPTPIQGGAQGKIDRATHLAASLQVSRKLGHSRTQVVNNYYGSYGHALRGTESSASYIVLSPKFSWS